MGNLSSLIWENLGEAYEWLKTKVVTFFRNLSKKTDESLKYARRFFDNFSEQFKEAIVKSKRNIDETMEKVVEVMHSLKSLFCLSLQAVKNKMSQLIKSLIAWLKKLWDFIKSFFAWMTELTRKTSRRSEENFGDEDFYSIYCLVTGFGQLIEITMCRPVRLFVVIWEAYLYYKMEPNKTIPEMKYGSCFKNLKEEEKKAALFVYVVLNSISSFISSRFV